MPVVDSLFGMSILCNDCTCLGYTGNRLTLSDRVSVFYRGQLPLNVLEKLMWGS
jgi:hypothetical protein